MSLRMTEEEYAALMARRLHATMLAAWLPQSLASLASPLRSQLSPRTKAAFAAFRHSSRTTSQTVARLLPRPLCVTL